MDLVTGSGGAFKHLEKLHGSLHTCYNSVCLAYEHTFVDK